MVFRKLRCIFAHLLKSRTNFKTVDQISYKTLSIKKSEVKKDWWIVDAENQVLGRLASKIAHYIKGKHKTTYTPHINCGDKIVIINADKVRLTGSKMANKEYQFYSGYPGGQKKKTAQQMMDKRPTFLVENAVRGMLSRNKLRKSLLKNLHIYAGAEHPHKVQNPKELKLDL